MTTHLARYFHVRRLEKGLRLGQVARMLGYRNLTKGSRLVQTFERTGKIDSRLLDKLATALEIDGKMRTRLVYQDYKEWFAGKPANRPVPASEERMGLPQGNSCAERLETVDEIEHYVAEYAEEEGRLDRVPRPQREADDAVLRGRHVDRNHRNCAKR